MTVIIPVLLVEVEPTVVVVGGALVLNLVWTESVVVERGFVVLEGDVVVVVNVVVPVVVDDTVVLLEDGVLEVVVLAEVALVVGVVTVDVVEIEVLAHLKESELYNQASIN